MSSWYSAHQGQSIGKVLHFISHYVGPHLREHCQVGDDKVVYEKKVIATITWETRTIERFNRSIMVDVPHFDFSVSVGFDPHEVKYWIKAQNDRKEQAVENLSVMDALRFADEPLPKLANGQVRY